MADVSGASAQLKQLFDRGGLVKIDGLLEPVHAAAAVAAGADLVGFIFAPARRQVTARTAQTCIAAAREAAAGRAMLAVGVFVDASASEIAEIVGEAGIDAVQLHGTEQPDFLENLAVPAFKALRPQMNSTAAQVTDEIESYRSAAVPPAGFLIDGYSDKASGGTGVRADWDLAAQVGAKYPIILAGGLDPGNVRSAIRHVRPLGVDVSSGVEIDGIKDVARITQFVLAARAAFAEK